MVVVTIVDSAGVRLQRGLWWMHGVGDTVLKASVCEAF